MLKKRIITVLWAIPLLVAAVWFDYPLPWLTILLSIWGLIAVFEFFQSSDVTHVPLLTTIGFGWTVLFIISPHFTSPLALPAILGSLVLISLSILLLLRKKDGIFSRWAFMLGGTLYIGWLLSYYVNLRELEDGRGWVFLALFTVFACDTTAYFIGRAWGKHHMAQQISPKKTWEGAVAGEIAAVIASIVLMLIFDLPLNYGQAIVLGLLVGVFAQTGDLVESLFKRNVGVKDSGKIMSGHGGMLDRTDSVVFAGIVVYYFIVGVVL